MRSATDARSVSRNQGKGSQPQLWPPDAREGCVRLTTVPRLRILDGIGMTWMTTEYRLRVVGLIRVTDPMRMLGKKVAAVVGILC